MNAVPDAKMAFCTRLRYSFVKIHTHHVNDLLLEIMKILWDFVKKQQQQKKPTGIIFPKREKFFPTGIKFR